MMTLQILFFLTTTAAAAPETAKPPVLAAMEAELERVMAGLKTEEGLRPYHVAYEIEDSTQVRLEASWGALTQDSSHRARLLDVDLRVGSHDLDSSHEVRGEGGMESDGRAAYLPIEDDPLALRQVIWAETDARFKEAVERFSGVRASLAVKAEVEDRSADFSVEEPRVDLREPQPLPVDRRAYAELIGRVSRIFLESPDVLDSSVTFDAEARVSTFASSEGTRLRYGLNQVRVMVYAATRADDGMDLFRYEGFEARDPSDLPGEEELSRAARRVMADLSALRAAPVIEPYTGPAILSGRAAAVFFHEIFGHRVEGHRQKSEDEGQTFTKKVNQPVLPPFLSVHDDPALQSLGGRDLMGHYPYDDEGVPGQRVTVVERGTLKSFLMSRSPIAGFGRSNGHGRRQPGYRAVGRQGNLLVTSDRVLPMKELRSRLKDLVRKQGKPFGLYFEDISGGFTFTQRQALQAYKVLPIMVYRVFPDDREDELVRGTDIVGTPLQSFGKIVAAGGDVQVFNGFCGAESGYVPVSASAPSVLVSEMEIEKRAKGVDRPPVLPAPTIESAEP